jgi:transposase
VLFDGKSLDNWVKTNGKDAALSSLLPLEASNWWEVWRAPAEVRDRREWMRHRANLVEMQTQVKNRIHAIFHRHGIYHDFSDLFGGRGRLFLERLCQGKEQQSRYLPQGAIVAMRDDLKLLEQLRDALARIAKLLHGHLERSELAQWLTSVPGFGLILAHVLMAEIGELGRFRNAKSLASYSLLAPRAWDTGDADPSRSPLGRHLGTRGNHTLKWAFIEAAQGAVRSGGQWRDMFDRLTAGGKRDRSRGYIAVARALVNVVYALWREERVYQDKRPVATEAAARSLKKSSRPGMGRPVNPLVAAQV